MSAADRTVRLSGRRGRLPRPGEAAVAADLANLKDDVVSEHMGAAIQQQEPAPRVVKVIHVKADEEFLVRRDAAGRIKIVIVKQRSA